MLESIIVAAITGGLSLVGVYIANRKSAALMEYRLEQLEKKVDKHNNVIERTYKLEERTELQEAELKRQNERLKVLEGGKR
jgi:hypothetical protein